MAETVLPFLKQHGFLLHFLCSPLPLNFGGTADLNHYGEKQQNRNEGEKLN